MAKSIQEITFDAVEAFWRSAMGDLGISIGETGYYCCAVAEYMRGKELDFRVVKRLHIPLDSDFFEELAAVLIRALAVEHASTEGATETKQ
jgi:hypothetical protein